MVCFAAKSQETGAITSAQLRSVEKLTQYIELTHKAKYRYTCEGTKAQAAH